MTITVDVDQEISGLFVRYLAQEDPHCNGDVDEHLAMLLHHEMMGHPLMRQCLDPNCVELVYPTMTIQQGQYAKNPNKRQHITAEAATVCPSCGGPLGTAA